MQPVCEYDDISRLDVMCISRLDSYAHTVYEMMNDDESLDQIDVENLEEKSRTDLDETHESRLENYDGSRLVFMSGYGKIFPLWVDKLPISCYAR